MSKKYSPSYKAFYDSAIHGNVIPADAVEITDEQYAALLVGQSSGKRITTDASGQPTLADPQQLGIDDERDLVIDRINEWRDQQEAAGILFAHAGHTWDGGLSVRQRLQPMLSLTELPPAFFWTDAENNDVPVTLTDLQALNTAHEAAIVARGFEIHIRQRQMKAEVATLSSVETLRAYVIGWPA